MSSHTSKGLPLGGIEAGRDLILKLALGSHGFGPIPHMWSATHARNCANIRIAKGRMYIHTSMNFIPKDMACPSIRFEGYVHRWGMLIRGNPTSLSPSVRLSLITNTASPCLAHLVQRAAARQCLSQMFYFLISCLSVSRIEVAMFKMRMSVIETNP
jgi:hypothetical protein